MIILIAATVVILVFFLAWHIEARRDDFYSSDIDEIE